MVATFNLTFFAATEYYNSQLDQLNQLESRYSKLKSVADIVQKYFVADYDEADAIEGALAGYIDGLGDQWSAYYNKEQTARLAEDDANVYVGIGVTFSTDPASLYTITAVTAGGPAAQAGLLAGDVIRAADGVDVDPGLLRGPDRPGQGGEGHRRGHHRGPGGERAHLHRHPG